MGDSALDCSSLNDSYSKSEKCFHFTDDENVIELSCNSSESSCSESDKHTCDDCCLNVKISEVLDPSFGMYVWPCAPILAKYIWKTRSRFIGKNVLELGAGTALPSVVVAKCGARVILSDSEKCEQTLEIGRHNMMQNNIPQENFSVVGLSWGNFNPVLISLGRVDFILGSDVFYEITDFEDVIVTVAYIMKRNPHSEFLCTYQQRCPDWNIARLLHKWDLTCEEVPIDELEYQAGYNMDEQTINLFIFRYKEVPIS